MNTNDMLSHAAQLSDQALLAQVQDLAQREREATVALIVHLAELDGRRLYLAEGYPSLFKYCTDVLHLAEHATYNRIEAARAVRRFPVLLEHLAAGWVTLFAVRLLAPHLTPENHREVLAQTRHKSKREIEELVARLRPQPPVPDVVRKLPVRKQAASAVSLASKAENARGGTMGDDTHEIMLAVATPAMPAPAIPPAPPARRAVVSPLAHERYKVQFTASGEFCAKLREAQALLRHQIPDGDLGQVFDRALDGLLANLRRQKLAATQQPREDRQQTSRAEPKSIPTSRHIPAAVRRAVWARDGGRCAFVSSGGRRCGAEAFLEFHHIVPYASGGPASVDNIQLRCRAHNGYEAECHFGRWDTVREGTAVYASSDSTAGATATTDMRAINSFWNEFEILIRGRGPVLRDYGERNSGSPGEISLNTQGDRVTDPQHTPLGHGRPRRIALGSQHPAKVAAATAVLRRVFPDAEIITLDVESGVRRSPVSPGETIQGALARARRAREHADADLGVGIEDGIEDTDHGTFLGSWAAVVDRSGRSGLGGGMRIALPPDLAEEARQGGDLGRLVRARAAPRDIDTLGAIGWLTGGLVTREEAHRQAIAAALVPFLPPT